MGSVRLEVMVERRADLTCYGRIPAQALEALGLPGGGTLGVSLSGHPIGQRALQRYDAGTWVLPLNAAHLRLAGDLSAGDRVTIELTVPDPPEAAPAAPAPTPAKRSRSKKA
jgi:hypothetical protein